MTFQVFPVGAKISIFTKSAVRLVIKFTTWERLTELMAAVAKHSNEAAQVRVATGSDLDWHRENKVSTQAWLDHVDSLDDDYDELIANSVPDSEEEAIAAELTVEKARKILQSSKWAKVRLVKAKTLNSIEKELVLAMAESVLRRAS